MLLTENVTNDSKHENKKLLLKMAAFTMLPCSATQWNYALWSISVTRKLATELKRSFYMTQGLLFVSLVLQNAPNVTETKHGLGDQLHFMYKQNYSHI